MIELVVNCGSIDSNATEPSYDAWLYHLSYNKFIIPSYLRLSSLFFKLVTIYYCHLILLNISCALFIWSLVYYYCCLYHSPFNIHNIIVDMPPRVSNLHLHYPNKPPLFLPIIVLPSPPICSIIPSSLFTLLRINNLARLGMMMLT